jgi:hypothetical protein
VISKEADFKKRLVTANHTNTWWYNMSPLRFFQGMLNSILFNSHIKKTDTNMLSVFSTTQVPREQLL